MTAGEIRTAIGALKDYAAKSGDLVLQALINLLEQAVASDTNVGGDYVGGDKTTVGNISGSKGVAIGRGASVDYQDNSQTNVTLNQTFESIDKQLEALPQRVETVTPQLVEDARAEVKMIEVELAKPDPPQEKWLESRFRNIARMGPDILDVVTATLLSPATGIATVVRKIAAKMREEAGLEPAAG